MNGDDAALLAAAGSDARAFRQLYDRYADSQFLGEYAPAPGQG